MTINRVFYSFCAFLPDNTPSKTKGRQKDTEQLIFLWI